MKNSEDTVNDETVTPMYDTNQALEALRDKIESIPQSQVRRLLFTRENATVVGMKTAALFRADRARIAASVNALTFAVSDYDDIEERTRAFWAADIQLRQATDTDAPVTLLTTEARELKHKLLKAATYLWGDEPETADVISAIRSGGGKANLADDIASLGTLFAERWEMARHGCTVEHKEVERAAKLGVLLVQAMGSTEVDEAAVLRNKAAEYFRRGIEEIRYAAIYAFRHEQEEIEKYPSLYTRRRKRPEADHDVMEAEESFSGIGVAADEAEAENGIVLATESNSPASLSKIDEPLSTVVQDSQ